MILMVRADSVNHLYKIKVFLGLLVLFGLIASHATCNLRPGLHGEDQDTSSMLRRRERSIFTTCPVQPAASITALNASLPTSMTM